ncbi:MAG: hypothetical protein A2Y34_15125 [Spirochaetes bacterium GWC1_27_15]|nr:MAG: hypothetical protein A2Y34_15125 [Spirochaetes bacterium GWC1_27_15]
MHLPDGFTDPKISAGLAGAAATVLGICIVKVKQLLSKKVPKLVEAMETGVGNITNSTKSFISANTSKIFLAGFVGALIFACQMFNFPINDGTSGHLLGGVLAATLLGPYLGIITMSVILIVQSLFFADGGFLVLGVNIFNMALVGCGLGYLIFFLLNKYLPFKKLNFGIAIFIASWSSVVLASAFCAIEVGLSGKANLQDTLYAMVSVHSIIGFFEAIITLILVYMLKLLKIDFGAKNE